MSFPAFAASLVLISFAAVSSLAPAQSDTFWQLRAGHDIVNNLRVPLYDTYSHTVTGSPWPNHSWLWQVMAYSLHSLGGFPLLTLVLAAQATAALAISFLLTPTHSRSSVVLLLLSVPILASTVALRPQVTSMLCFAVLLWLLTRERYAWVPLLFLVWANFHAAVVVGGLTLAVATGLAAVLWWRNPSTGTQSRLHRLVLITGLSALATLVTPMGADLWSYVASSLTKAGGSGVSEFGSALQWSWGSLPFLLWCAALLAMVAARWRTLVTWGDRLLIAVSMAMIPLGLAAVRNISWVILASLPALIALTRGSRAGRSSVGTGSRAHNWVTAGVAGAAMACVAVIWSVPGNGLGWRPVTPGVVAAVAGCPGRLYNPYDEGGYLIWFTPQVPVFVDSRYDPYPAPFLERGRAVESTGDYRSLFDDYDIDCAALPNGSRTASTLMDDGWAAAVTDDSWAVLYPPSLASQAD